MASSKRIGFFWGEEKLTLVEFEKNAPLRVVSSPWDLKTDTSSPFSSSLPDEIQLAAIFQKMLQDNRLTGGPFYVSLPMKEIILRSFVIPFVKKGDIQNAVKFEAKKYLPIDIQDLNFVFTAAPFTESQIKRLQIIFFAVRKESLARYQRIFKQVNAVISYGEPSVVSLTKVLLFKKEITLSDHLAFLILDKNSGRICFINHGIPQFVREFTIGSRFPLEETTDTKETLNLKIVNEVANSFDFYARQFTGEKIEQTLVSSQGQDEDLFNALETELKLKLRKISPVVTMGAAGQSHDMDAIYAMGACVEPPMEALSGFNFIEGETLKSKFKGDLIEILKPYKEILFVFLICVISLAGAYVFFQAQLKVAQQQYDQLSFRQGAFLNTPVAGIQDELQRDTQKLAAYKKIRIKSDVAFILLRIASHVPRGARLKELSVSYDQGGSDLSQGGPLNGSNGSYDQNASNEAYVTIYIRGDVLGQDSSEQIAAVNRILSDFKNDKELSRFIKKVKLVSLNREDLNGRQVTEFNIHCS